MTKVINKQSTDPSRAHARVEGQLYSSPSGFINKPRSPSTGARTRVREEGRRKIANEAAYFKAWRKARFGGDFDPVRMAVDEADAEPAAEAPAPAKGVAAAHRKRHCKETETGQKDSHRKNLRDSF